MCDSMEEGGKRCAAHTRPPYEKVVDALTAVNKFGRNKVRAGKASADETNMMVVANHASTPAGKKEIEALLPTFQAEADMQTVQWLRSCLKSGASKAEAAKEVKAEITKAKAKRKRAETNSMNELKVNPKITPEESHAAKYPEIAAMWAPPEENNGVRPDQVSPKANAGVILVCPQGHRFKGRLNNYANYWDRGRRPSCPECSPRRQKALEDMQDRFKGYLTCIDDDPDAWEALPPALRYSLMQKAGLLGGGVDAFERSTAIAMIHGDLTLADVVTAKKVEDIEFNVNEAVDNDEGQLGEFDDNVLVANGPAEEAEVAQGTRIDRIMASAGSAGILPDDEVLAAQIMHENVEALWNEVHNTPEDVDGILARIRTGADSNPYRAALARRFEDEVDAVRSMPLPEGYVSTRTAPDGTVVERDPLLSQRRFALLVEDRNRVMNWSGTGAGKTLSAVLAVRKADAQETLVMAPLAVTDQWKAEFEAAFPDTEVRMGLPEAGEDLDATRTGRPRVWIANYDKLQNDPKEVEERLAPLADRLDAAVLDEIHYAKSSDASTHSNRRGVLQGFLDRAGEKNENLKVVGASATPVITNLEEARGLLRLVSGEDPKGFGTAPTMKNAALAYQHLSASGVRWMPNYPVKLDKPEVTVDITANLDRVQARVDAMVAKNPRMKNQPSTMERALLPEKMPAIVAAVRKADGPTVIYSEYVTGMVDPLIERMQAEGFRTARYTGEMNMTERREVLAAFDRGEIDVLVGSKPISTGVDGLQKRCRNLVIASAPWTAAAETQVIGRLLRRGQQHDVTVTHILTEAKVGSTTWSWCRTNRLNRLKFRRSLSDAATDGIMPDATLGDIKESAKASMTVLRDLNASLTATQQAA